MQDNARPTMTEDAARVLVDFDRELGRGLSAKESTVLKEARAALAYYAAQRKAGQKTAA